MSDSAMSGSAQQGAPGGNAPGTDTYAAWRRGVAGVIAKSRRVEADALGTEPESLLNSQTYDGVTIKPLYGPLDERPEHPLPGEFPYVRGRAANRDVTRGWHVSARIGEGIADPAEINAAILSGLENGVSSIWLVADALDAADLGRALEGVLLDLAPITLAAGATTAPLARALLTHLDTATVHDRSTVDIRLGASPLTDALTGTAGASVEQALALVAEIGERPEQVRAITVDGTAFHNAGAADAQEIGLSAAAGLDYVRLLTEAGTTIPAALAQLEFHLAATDAQFETIAKFRAARRVWARVAEVLGEPAGGAAPQHAVTSAAMMAQRDPWVNMLRTTLAAFGAGVGGADSVTVLPFDVSLPEGALEVTASFSERIARNTQLLLLEESHLGRVLDPAAGSWYVEDLTDRLAERAWTVFTDIERAGGYRAALAEGRIAADIGSTRDARATDIAHRRTSLTGVNEFPNLAEKPLPAATPPGPGTVRYAQDFERLRDLSDAHLASTGARPVAVLVPLGSVAEHNGRTTFVSNLLASGGIEARYTPEVTDIAETVRASGASVAVLCGTDQRYADEGPAAVASIRQAGIDHVLVAGPPRPFEGADDQSAPTGHLTLRIDAVAVLGDLLNRLTNLDRSRL